jgi:DNA-binding transcriptional regulator YhcF (GntR family)
LGWIFDADRPIYAQLVEQLSARILSGVYPPGSRLDSVRDLAAEAAVNPNTMQKALGELERQGLVFAQRTAGRFVTEDTDRIAALRQELAAQHIRAFLDQMEGLGCQRGDIPALVATYLEKEEQS